MDINLIINATIKEIEANAYKKQILEEISLLGFKERIMELHSNEARGKASGQMDILGYIEKSFENATAAYERGMDSAMIDIKNANHYIESLLVYAGYMPGTYDKEVEEFYENLKDQ